MLKTALTKCTNKEEKYSFRQNKLEREKNAKILCRKMVFLLSTTSQCCVVLESLDLEVGIYFFVPCEKLYISHIVSLFY